MTKELTHTAKGETETFTVKAAVSKSGEGKQVKHLFRSVSPAIRSTFFMVAVDLGAFVMIKTRAATAEILSKPW